MLLRCGLRETCVLSREEAEEFTRRMEKDGWLQTETCGVDQFAQCCDLVAFSICDIPYYVGVGNARVIKTFLDI